MSRERAGESAGYSPLFGFERSSYRFKCSSEHRSVSYVEGHGDLARLPDLPVVLVSEDTAWKSSLAQPDLIVANLAKPFGTEELGRTIREALAASSGGLQELTV